MKINLNDWTHYTADDAGSFLLFSLEHCDDCGAEVLAPNSINVRCSESLLKAAGLINYPAPDGELYPADNGDYVCGDCAYAEASEAIDSYDHELIEADHR